MAAEWFYLRDGTKFGPIDASTLKQLAESGVIGPADAVWKQGMAQWARASAVRGLFDAQASADNTGARPQCAPSSETADAGGWPFSGNAETPIISQDRKRPARKRKAFPALGFVAGLFTAIAIMITGGGLIVFVGIVLNALMVDSEIPKAPLIAGAFATILFSAAFAVVYLAAAEFVRLALYAVTLLEDIREQG